MDNYGSSVNNRNAKRGYEDLTSQGSHEDELAPNLANPRSMGSTAFELNNIPDDNSHNETLGQITEVDRSRDASEHPAPRQPETPSPELNRLGQEKLFTEKTISAAGMKAVQQAVDALSENPAEAYDAIRGQLDKNLYNAYGESAAWTGDKPTQGGQK